MKNKSQIYRTIILLVCVFAGLLPLQAQEPAEPFHQLMFTDYTWQIFRASSTLESSRYPFLGQYGMQALFDGDSYTGWSEGAAGDGTGEVLWLEIEEGSDTLLIKNGFSRSEDLFQKNNRVKSLSLSLWCGFLPGAMVSEYGPLYVMFPVDQHVSIGLDDTMKVQEHRFEFDFDAAGQKIREAEERFPGYAEEADLPSNIDKTVFLLRMEIREVYQGNKWNDTCLTELRCFNSAEFHPVEMESLNGTLRYRTSSGWWWSLYADREMLFDPYLISPDGKWCVAFMSPREAVGRAGTDYVLFHLPYPELYEHAGFEDAVYSGKLPTEFLQENGKLFLVFDDGSRIILE